MTRQLSDALRVLADRAPAPGAAAPAGGSPVRAALDAAVVRTRELLGARVATITLLTGGSPLVASSSAPSTTATATDPDGDAPELSAALLADDGAAVGHLTVEGGRDGGFSAEDRAVLAQLARLTVTDLEHAGALGTRARAEERLRFVSEASRALARSFDYDRTLEEVARLAVPTLADYCFFDLLDASGELERVAVAHATDPGFGERVRRFVPAPANDGHPVRVALATSRPVLVERVDDDWIAAVSDSPEMADVMRAQGISAVLSLPVVGRAPLGVLTMVATGGRAYAPADVAAAEELTRRAAVAIDNARLVESATFQRSLLVAQGEASIDGLLVVGAAGEIRSHNSRFLEIWEMSEQTLAHGDEAALAHAQGRLEDPESFIAGVREVYATRSSSRDELRFRDGRTIERYGAPVVGDEGTYYGYLWSFRDITERLLGEEARELTRIIAENATSALFLLDAAGRPTYMNAAAEAMVGRRLEEIADRTLHDTIHHTRPDGTPFPFEECPITQALPGRRMVGPYEDVFIRGDGTRFPVRVAASPIVRADAPLGTVIEAQDITAERRAREEVQKFVALVDSSTDFVGMATLDGVTVYLNPAGCSLVGIDPDAAPGTPLIDFVAPQSRGIVVDLALPQARRSGRHAGEWELRHLVTGEPIPVEGSVFLIQDPVGGEPLALATVQRDIRARRRREAERAAVLTRERSERERQALLAEVTHTLDRALGVRQRLERLADTLVPALGDACLIDLLHGDALVRTIARHADPERRDVLAALGGAGPGGLLPGPLESGAPMLVEDASEPGDVDASALAALDARSLMMVVLGSRGRRLGMLALATTSRSERRFGPDDLALLAEVGARAGVAIDNARLFEEEERARREAEVARRRLSDLHGLATDLSGALSRAQVAAVGARAARAAFGAAGAWLALQEGEPADLVTHALEGVAEPEASVLRELDPEAAHPLVEALRRRSPVFLDGGREVRDRHPAFARAATCTGGLAVVPLAPSEGTGGGALALWFDAPDGLADEDHRQLGAMVDLIAQALSRAGRYERERELSHILQTSLLPAELPRMPGFALAARYSPGAEGTEAGGDWYDALVLSDGRLAVTVGDVVGRGPHAAAVMGQMRSALNAYLSAGDRPAVALGRLNAFAARVPGALATSALCVVIDRDAGTLDWACAGHPDPILVGPDGARSLTAARGPVLGVVADAVYPENAGGLRAGETILMFSDGLFERRNEDLPTGIARLEGIAARARGVGAAAAVDLVWARATGGGAGDDDVVVVAATLLPPGCHLEIAARPDASARARAALADWAAPLGLPRRAAGDLALALSEAASNAVEHAYAGDASGAIDVRFDVREDGTIVVGVRDEGAWRRPSPEAARDRGRGIALMRATMDEVLISPSPSGTEVELHLLPRPPADDEPGTGSSSVGGPAPFALATTGAALAVSGDVDPPDARAVGRALRADPPPAVLDLRAARHFGSAAVAAVVAAAVGRPAGDPLVVRVRRGGTPERALALAAPDAPLRVELDEG